MERQSSARTKCALDNKGLIMTPWSAPDLQGANLAAGSCSRQDRKLCIMPRMTIRVELHVSKGCGDPLGPVL